MDCAHCDKKACYRGADCAREATAASRERMDDPAVRASMEAAAAIEARGYGRLTRLEEIVSYCERTGITHVGVAFCYGLSEEARVLVDLLAACGLEVDSVCCKVGGLQKEELGLERLHPDWKREATCNPVGQAKVLQQAGTQLNLVVGLCVGHDIQFINHSAAPVTPFVVKDRVLAHNPAGVLYSRYHRKRFLPEE